jgi:hypothetical protein
MNIGRSCENLNDIIGEGAWYDKFSPQNTKWLSLVKDIVASINSGCFGLYPSFVAGILNSVETIHFYVLCNKHPNYTHYIKKCTANEKCRFHYKSITNNCFLVSCGSEEIAVSFEERLLDGQLPSELIFAQGVLKNSLIISNIRHRVC